MRFLIFRKADADTEQGAMPSDELLTAMGAYNEQLVNAGVMRAGEQLHLTPQTLSGQIKLLEERLGCALFRNDGGGTFTDVLCVTPAAEVE